MSKYEKQAIDFLAKTGVTLEIKFLRNAPYFTDDKETRDIYQFTIKRGQRTYSAEFGQSIMNSQHYADSIVGRTYTLNGRSRTGGYSINDISKYMSGGQKLTLVKGVVPTAYGILACLTKYDPGTFEYFCSEFGFDTDSKKAEKTYKAVKEEWLNVCSIWTDAELEELQEIQ